MSTRKKFDLYVVEEGKDREGNPKNYWNKVGGGFENQDGSLSLKLLMFPGLLLQLREYVPRNEREGGDRDDRDDRDDRGRGRNDTRRGGGGRR